MKYVVITIIAALLLIFFGCLCAADRQDKIDKNINDDIYVKLRLNKCYLQYLKDLYYDFYDRKESIYVKELIFHIQYFINDDGYNIYKFYELMENTKINILSQI